MPDPDGLRKLVQQVIADPQLLRKALADPDGTLAALGAHLSADEVAAVRSFAARMAAREPAQVATELAAALGDRSALNF